MRSHWAEADCGTREQGGTGAPCRQADGTRDQVSRDIRCSIFHKAIVRLEFVDQLRKRSGWLTHPPRRAKTPSESSDYCGWSSLNATGACLLNPGGRQIFGQQRSLCGLLNVPVDMRCARNPALESDAVFVREPFRLRTARERRRHRVGFSSSTRHFSTEGLAALPLAFCQRIALSSCALTASGREKFIAADFFAPGAFLSFIR